ncbi:hypothetical protein A3K55_02400, partial [Candidatus Shapirobacteria bacterium RBG_13_44_7]
MVKKLRVMVLMGGRSSEREVSLVSGKGVVRHLDEMRYEVLPIEISVDGKEWKAIEKSELLKLDYKIEREVSERALEKVAGEGRLMPKIETKPDVVFIALHGKYGEDGTVQGMLDFLGLPYTGCGVLASAIGMDKIMFRKVMENLGIPMPRLVKKAPCVVKPADAGSSVGVSIVKKDGDLEKAIELAKKYSDRVIVEEYIKGVEVSCGVIGNENPMALPVVEIRPKKDFFDYEAKYTEGMCEEVCPAEIPDEVVKLVKDYAVRVFRGIGGRGFGRVDMIIRDGQPYVLEINTIPGLTPNSLLPKEAKAMGMSYEELLDKIIELA